MPTSETEAALIHRAREGDSRAVDDLVKLWSPRVRRFAARLCPVTEALDAAQESLFLLTSGIHGLRSTEAVVSWTFQIVKRQCIKVFSRFRKDTALARELGHLQPEAAEPVTDRRAWLDELARVLSQLPDREKTILMLRDFEELPLRETCQRLGLSEAAAKSRLHRARSLLRERMLASPLARTLPEW